MSIRVSAGFSAVLAVTTTVWVGCTSAPSIQTGERPIDVGTLGAADPGRPIRRYVASLAIGDYGHPGRDPLPSAEGDATALGELLESGYGFYRFPPVLGTDATPAGLRDLLARVGARVCPAERRPEHGGACPDSLLILHFSGHGAEIPCSSEGEAKTCGALSLYGADGPVDFPVEDLLVEVKRLPVHQVVVLLDMCRAGLALQGTVRLIDDPLPGAGPLAERWSRKVLAATGPYTEAWQGERVHRHSHFTAALVAAFDGQRGDLYADGTISFRELGLFVQNEVRVSSGKQQIPMYGGLGGLTWADKGGDPVLVRLRLPEESVASNPAVDPDELKARFEARWRMGHFEVAESLFAAFNAARRQEEVYVRQQALLARRAQERGDHEAADRYWNRAQATRENGQTVATLQTALLETARARTAARAAAPEAGSRRLAALRQVEEAMAQLPHLVRAQSRAGLASDALAEGAGSLGAGLIALNAETRAVLPAIERARLDGLDARALKAVEPAVPVGARAREVEVRMAAGDMSGAEPPAASKGSLCAREPLDGCAMASADHVSEALSGGASPPESGEQVEPTRERGVLPATQYRPAMMPIPAGTFWVGSSADEAGRDDDEHRRRVTLRQGWWMARTEVTQAQWTALMVGRQPSLSEDTRPVERVSWFAALAFCNRLSDVEGLPNCYRLDGCVGVPGRGYQCTSVAQVAECNGYRLPSEAEWERSVRGGSSGSRYGRLDEIAWFDSNSTGSAHPVGLKRPNTYGLHDMLGNVWEWTFDTYRSDISANADGAAVDSSNLRHRVARGCGWRNDASTCRAAYRSYDRPASRFAFLGFRVSRTRPVALKALGP